MVVNYKVALTVPSGESVCVVIWLGAMDEDYVGQEYWTYTFHDNPLSRRRWHKISVNAVSWTSHSFNGH